MPVIASLRESMHKKFRREAKGEIPGGYRVDLLDGDKNTPHESPMAFVVGYDPQATSSAHFHPIDQFQIVMSGEGTIGRHAASPYYVHFSRAYTPYGPLCSPKGWEFLTLRTCWDEGANRMPESRSLLTRIVNRDPWQISRNLKFEGGLVTKGTKLDAVEGMEDKHGMRVSALTMAAHTQFDTPDPSPGHGQFVVVVEGSLVHESKNYAALSVLFTKPHEGPIAIGAGADGLKAIVLRFPKRRQNLHVVPA